jgi:TolB protein
MKANGDNKTQLTDNQAFNANPAFSPNGKKIAFQSPRNGKQDIFTMNANGTHQKRVTRSRKHDYNPAWSPDGTRIAFSGTSQDVNTHGIYVMKAKPESATNRPKRLTGNRSHSGEPDWQPLR